MTRRQRIMAVVGALAILGVTLTTGSGHGDGHVGESSVTILPGPLVTTLTWVSFEEHSLGPGGESQNGYLVLRVLDERGYATGWNVSLSTTDSVHASNNLGTGQLTLSPGAVSLVRGNPDLAGHATFEVDPVRTTPALLWSAPQHSGDGEYDLPLASTHGLPGGQHRNYPYTVIVHIGGSAP